MIGSLSRTLGCNAFTRNRLVSTAGLACLLILAACGSETPFATNVYVFNEQGPQQPAAIEISDPQIYARETLINDRLRERKLLEDLLEESKARNFREELSVPAMIRDLETVEAFRAAVDVDFDPAKGRQASRDEELAELQNEIDATEKERALVRKKIDLAKAERELHEARFLPDNDMGDGDDSPAPAGPENAEENNSNNPGGDDANNEQAEKIERAAERAAKVLEDLEGKIDRLDSRLARLRARFGGRTVTVPIPDAERSRDAYRAELRHRLNAVNLDDLHDFKGNALYRLQFRASVMPGEHKDKFGIARLTFLPPRLAERDVDKLYRTWVLHLASRLNYPFPAAREKCPRSIGSILRVNESQLVKIHAIPYEVENNKLAEQGLDMVQLTNWHITGPTWVKEQTKSLHENQGNQGENDPEYCVLYIPTHPNTELKDLVSDPLARASLEVIASSNRSHEPTHLLARTLLDFVPGKLAPGPQRTGAQQSSNTPVAFKQIVSTTHGAATDFAEVDWASRSDFDVSQDPNQDRWPNNNEETIRQAVEASARARDIIRKASDPTNGPKPTAQAILLAKETIRQAEEIIRQDRRTTRRARGTAYAYAAAPLEKSQRLSTNAQTARSLELALSFAASLPTKGVDAGLDLGFVRESAGIAEAFENQPIVVGFAERRGRVEREERRWSERVYRAPFQAPQVGWVFGPKVRMDTKNSALELVHGFATHEVSADLSIPGWWPGLDAILETAWIGNLHNVGRPIRLEDEPGQGFHRERFSFDLPLNEADLDGLTEYILSEIVGTSVSFIAVNHVEPFYISACSAKVKLLIEGANVWRSARAFLGGIEAEDISILPDMQGIAATFDLDKLFETDNFAHHGLGLEQGVRLVVWTRNGSAELGMRLIGSRQKGSPGTCISRTTVSSATSLSNFEIIDVSPAQICANWETANFLIKAINGLKDEEITAIFGNQVVKAKPLNEDPKKVRGHRIYQLQFKGGPFAVPGRPLSLEAAHRDDLTRVPIRVVDCAKTAKPPKTQQASKPKLKQARVLESVTVASVKNNNYSFSLKLAGIDPALLKLPHGKDLRVGVLPVADSTANAKASDWILSTTALLESDEEFKVSFAVPQAATSGPPHLFKAPQVLKVGLLQRKKDSVELLQTLKQTPVYYHEDAATVVKTKGPGKLSLAEQTLTLTLPQHHKLAYPALAKSGVMAEVEGNAEVELDVKIDFSKVDPATNKVTGKIVILKMPTTDTENELSGPKMIKLKFKKLDLPDIQPFTATLPPSTS